MPRGQIHPLRDEFRALGYAGVIEKYGSTGKAAKAVGTTLRNILNWAPRLQGRARHPDYPDLPVGSGKVLKVIQRLTLETGRSPSIREVGAMAGFTSTNGVSDHLNILMREGYVVRPSKRCARERTRLTEKAGVAPSVPWSAIRYLSGYCLLMGGQVEHAAKEVQAWARKANK